MLLRDCVVGTGPPRNFCCQDCETRLLAAIFRCMGDARRDRAAASKRWLTQYCVGCKSRKSIKGFSIRSGLCADCVRKVGQGRPKAANKSLRAKKPPAPPGPTTWKCPNCLRRVDVNRTRTALVDHLNRKGQRCGGSGYQLPEKRTDAMDYRAPGSFEGGRR